MSKQIRGDVDVHADLRWLIAIAERERHRLLDEQNNTSQEEGRQLGMAIVRVKNELLSPYRNKPEF